MEYRRIEIEPGSTLGLAYSGCHDSAVAVVGPSGAIAFACSLERVTRRKHDGRFPSALLDLLDMSRLAICALPCYAPDALPTGPTGERFHQLAHGCADYPQPLFPEAFYQQIARVPLPKRFVGHHISHAASAYYLSGFDAATVLSYDAGMFNCPWFGGVFRAERGRIEPIEFFPIRSGAKIATLYAIVTGLLGFKPLRHEGKLTGLAALGTPSSDCERVLREWLGERYGELEAAGRWIHSFDPERVPQFVMDPEACRQLRARFGSASAADIAASLQRLTEQHVLEIAARVRAECSGDNLCLAGGLFANVRLNQRLAAQWRGRIFVAPPMGDEGTALGAALWQVHGAGTLDHRARPTTMSLGPSYPPAVLPEWLDGEGIVHTQPQDLARETAQLLAAGQIVALFQGASEFGPRALGQRSILAPATRPDVNAVLNHKLRRSEFMPFAPITRVEDAALEYLGVAGVEGAAAFMTITCDVSDHLRATCPAVVHVDGTARPQLVSREAHPFLHAVLTEYQAATGISSLINTSFNIHEEPIVSTPQDALRGFFTAGIDALLIEGCLIRAADNVEAGLASHATGGHSEETQDLADYLWSRLGAAESELERKERVIETLNGELFRVSELPARLDRMEAHLARLATAAEAVLTEHRSLELEHARQLAEASQVADARLSVIEEQQAALDSYRRSSLRHRFAPRLGVLYQYPPRPLAIPPHYAARRAPEPAPAITLVTPSFQQGTFLERTLTSVLDQGYPQLDYVVQDGGSTDASLEVLRRLAPRLARWQSAPDGGQAHAINLGFGGSRGEIMAYLNSDDLLLPGALAFVAEFFARHPAVDVVYGHRVVIDEDDREIGRWVLPPHDAAVLSWADYVPQETLFWRRRIWERIGAAIDESFRFAMDWDLLLRFREAGARFARLPRFLGAFRVHLQQKTTARMADVGHQEMARLRERCHGRPVTDAEIRKHLRGYMARHVVVNKLYRLGILRY